MGDWYMLVLIGEDRPGIVAEVSPALHAGGCNLGEAFTMGRRGDFVILVTVRHNGIGVTSRSDWHNVLATSRHLPVVRSAAELCFYGNPRV